MDGHWSQPSLMLPSWQTLKMGQLEESDDLTMGRASVFPLD